MRKSLPLILLLVTATIVSTLSVKAQPEPSEYWDNRYSHVLDYRNGTYTTTFSLGPQVFWNGSGWQELKFEDLGNGYLMENSMITAYVYEWYTSYYDPDNQRVCVDDERWIIEVYNEKTKKWREVDLYNPSLSYSNNATHLTVTRSFDTYEGLFNVTYILWQGGRLKHDVKFISRITGDNQFRVTMKLTGIYSDKVKHSGGVETINSERHILSPFFVFGEDDNNLVFSEYLWELGETNEETGEWTSTTLKDVVLDTSAQGSKMDIIIGNYVLAENESLRIDPDSDTWEVNAATDDCIKRVKNAATEFSVIKTTGYIGYQRDTLYKMGCGFRFLNVEIPKDSTINAATVSFYAYESNSATVINSRISGEDTDDAATFSDLENFDARDRTMAVVDWDNIGAWTLNTRYDSPEIKTVIQEIVNRGGWSSGNDLVIFWDDWDDRTDHSDSHSRRHDHIEIGSGEYAILSVTWRETQEYSRDASQGIFWGGGAYRKWDAARIFTQGIGFTSDSLRSWSLSRAFKQEISLSSSTDRSWSIIRVVTQGITATIEANRFLSSIRQASQNIALSSSAGRIGTFLRGLSQSFTLASNAFRGWSLTRSFSQGLSFISNIVIKFTEYFPSGEEFIKSVTLSLELVPNNMRFWDLSRAFSQTISINSGVWAKWYQNVIRRYATMSIQLDMHLAVLQTIVNEFNAPLIMLILTSIVFTVLYVIKEGTIWVGFTSGTSWAATAFVILRENPEYWPYTLFFSALSLVLYWLTVVEIIELKEVPWM